MILASAGNLYAQSKPVQNLVGIESTAQSEQAQQKPSQTDDGANKPPSQTRTVKNAGQPEPPCGQRCQAAEQREKDDLIAQQQMALGTEQLVGVAWWQFGLGVLGLVLVAFTAAYARNAAHEAKRAATAAEDTLDHARKSSKQELRAYLSLTPAGVSRHPQKGTAIHVKQKNSGQTPAKNVRFYGTVVGLESDLPDDFIFPDPMQTPGINVVHPGSEFTVDVWAEPRIQIRDIQILIGGRKRLYFIGCIKYLDVFGDEWETQVCWSHSPAEIHTSVAVGGSDPTKVQFIYSEKHNDAT